MVTRNGLLTTRQMGFIVLDNQRPLEQTGITDTDQGAACTTVYAARKDRADTAASQQMHLPKRAGPVERVPFHCYHG